MNTGDALGQVQATLTRHLGEFTGTYRIPRFLKDEGLVTELVDVGDPCRYFIDVIDGIMSRSVESPADTGLHERDLVYLSFMRSFASLNSQVGTPLKQLAFLMHLKDALGASVLICLPTGVIGKANRKGRRGSPFAVSNPFDVDSSMRDPLVPELPAITLYQALSQACQHLGIRLGSIVPMATLAIDSPLYRYFPELGYWWRATPGERLHARETAPWFPGADYSPPMVQAAAAKRFRPAPSRSELTSTRTRHGVFYLAADTVGQPVTLANAYPDVLAGEAETYTWEDVSPVRYTNSLTPSPMGLRRDQTKDDLVRPAVLIMATVIAWRYCELRERVLIIDVAPSVPDIVLETARALCTAWPRQLGIQLRDLGGGQLSNADADRLLAEIADIARLQNGQSVADLYLVAEELWDFAVPSLAYEAVTGPITSCVSAHSHDITVFQESLRHHLTVLHDMREPSRHLPSVSNHDTNPPKLAMARRMLLFYSFLPGATPMIFSGSEWGFEAIVNKEFGFPATCGTSNSSLVTGTSAALFNDYACEWGTTIDIGPPLHDLRQWIARKITEHNVNDTWSYAMLTELDSECAGYIRVSPDNAIMIAVVWNFKCVAQQADLALAAVMDAISWPPYVAAGDGAELSLIPPSTVSVLIGKVTDGATSTSYSRDLRAWLSHADATRSCPS